MQPLTLLWGCLLIPGCRALMGPKEIRGFEGDTVSLQCTYEEELRTYKKYWCRRRGFLFSRCSGAIYVEGDGQERTEGRVSVQDRPRELILKVTLRNLTLQDAGNYFCGVKKLGPDETFMVSLLIFPGTSHPASPLDPTSAEDASVVSSSSSKSSSTGHRGTEEQEGPTLTLASREELHPRVRLDQSCRAHWAPCQPEALCQPPHGDPVPKPGVDRGPWGLEPPNLAPHWQCGQTSEEDEAPSPDLEGDMFPGPPTHTSDEQLDFSKFISV
ncbi:CMRF35-like molecule 9 isoform X12 [Manis pentadactyla]|uniref:CMRF35-like molecule 9 isoform X12 n=1 Tax=Manis pentadactyla TaxID=143292 RepID=UPI00255CF294|nr:CMRF35-like molecule 9 isoform X12 [Manis pentadactyla]